MDIRARSRLVNRLADAFEANLDSLYRLETLNNGRPVNETRAQLSRLPDFFRYFAGLALSRRDSVIPVEGSYLNYTLRTPIGIVANCTPFNHPLMILCKSLAAVLASGCVTVVKPSEYTPLTTLKLAQIFTEAGLPPGVFNIVLGLGQSAGKMLAEHDVPRHQKARRHEAPPHRCTPGRVDRGRHRHSCRSSRHLHHRAGNAAGA